MQHSSDAFCSKLRRLVQSATEKRWSQSAVFYAEKLLTLSDSDADAYIYAQALFDNKEYSRAASLIKSRNCARRNYKFATLLGRCLLESKAYGECLALIGGEDDQEELGIPLDDATEDMIASLCVIRARAFEGKNHAELAVPWYKKALSADPFCYEAFHSLLSRNMLPHKEEQKLTQSLSCEPRAGWIKALYDCLCSKYVDDFEAKVKDLKEVVKQPTSGRAFRVSDHPNRSSGSHGESGTGSSLAAVDQSENGENETAEQLKPGLDNSIDIKIARAEWHYYRGANMDAYLITHKLMEDHPEAVDIYPVHLGACLELNNKRELYSIAQQLSELVPDTALAWYGTGVYYMCVKRYTEARKAFLRSQAKDKYFALSLIGLGNSFAAQSETQQASEAYRRAESRFPGLHLPAVYIGMEKLRSNDLDGAESSFLYAYQLCTEDPLILNQLGMVAYHKGNYEEAINWFERATGKISCKESGANWEAIHLNKGHAMRKCKRFDEALESYQQAAKLCPRNAATYTAIGFTYHLQDKLKEAVENYWTALIYDPNDTFAAERLRDASSEDLGLPEYLFET